MASQTLFLRVADVLPVAVSRRLQEDMAWQLNDGAVARVYAVDTEPGITNSGKAMLEVTSTHEVPAEWLDVLIGIRQGLPPDGFVPGTPGHIFYDFYPAGLRDFYSKTTAQLRQAALTAWGLLRWRQHSDVPRGGVFTPHETQWSDDGTTWAPLHGPYSIYAELLPNVSLSDRLSGDLESLALAGLREPAGRDIWHVAVKADPTTRLVLAVTAVEVETKRLVAGLLPDAEWLVTNLPAPPVVRILEEYVPKIAKIDPKMAPPKHLLVSLRRAVRLRNDSVHVGPSDDSRWLDGAYTNAAEDPVLIATSDLLWLLDFYRGHQWALDYLSDETRAALGLSIAEQGFDNGRNPYSRPEE